ncbi:MAG: indolepyruvate oxidoreductase subunit beta [Rhodoferax sp.]|jgi:indolepyruvate ferredoxin oxidoreductase beta subunit|nr:indolepyruvate oxidoreductase subunit beta [Rhodoferax sp.]
MNFDLVIAGVGGQGVLTIAAVLDRAAHAAGLHVKQSEVHGMAQRGGAVSAFVRMSDQPVASDLIGRGCASLLLSVEPLEALRYTQLLRPDGWIVSDITPMRNMPDYPALDAVYRVLFSAPQLVALDATRLAQKAGTIKAQNIAALGAAAQHLPLPVELIEQQIRALFENKGERIVNANLHAFRKGDAAARFTTALLAAGIPGNTVAKATSHIHFPPHPVPADVLAAWCQRLSGADAQKVIQGLLDHEELTRLELHATS